MSVSSAASARPSSWPAALRARLARHPVSPAALGLAGLIVLSAVLRGYGLGHQGFWYDEANTAQLVRFTPGKMLGLIGQSESTPPLYYCVAWVWARVFGDGEAGLRSLSVLAGVLVVPVAYATATTLINRRAGIICAALAACNPFLIWYSQEARSYELLVLLSGLSLLAWSRARAAPSPRPVALWAIFSVLALATHYYALVLVLPEAAWLLVDHRARLTVRIAVAVVGVCGAALLPLAISQNGTGHDGWIATAPLGPRLRQIIPQLLIGTDSPARVAMKYAAFAAALVALGLLAARAGRTLRERALPAGALALGGFAFTLVLIVAGFDDLITRNIIALWLPAAIVVSAGLAAPAARRVGVAAAAVLCAIGLVATIGIAANRALQRPDWRPVARLLGPAPARGDRLILVQHYADLLPLSLYLHDLRRLRTAGARVSAFDVISMRSPQQPLCWWGAACNLIPSAMQRTYRLRGFRPAWRRQSHQFTVLALAARSPTVVTEAEVAAALRTTTLRHDELIVQPPSTARRRPQARRV